MPDTYTSSFGSTPIGNQQQQMYNTLASITGVAPSDTLGQKATQAYAGATSLGLNQPSAVNQNLQQLIGQSGIPSLQSGQQDLGKMFSLYLQDQGLANKFSAPILQNYAPGSNTPTVATYQQNPAAIVQQFTGATGSPGQGFQGFSTPGINTAAMGAAPIASSDIISNLGTAIANQQGIVSQQSDLYSQNYQAAINALTGASDFYLKLKQLETPGTQQWKINQSRAANRDASSGMLLTEMLGKYSGILTPDEVYNIYTLYNHTQPDGTMAGYGDPVESQDQLYRWGIKEQKPTAASSKLAAEYGTRVSKIKAFGDLVDAYYSNSDSIGPLSFLKSIDAMRQFAAQRDLYIGGVSKDLGISRSNPRFEDLKSKMPTDTVSIGSEGSFRGHLATLLDLTQLVMYVDNNSGETGVEDVKSFDPNSQTVIDPQTDDFNLIKGIIGGIK